MSSMTEKVRWTLAGVLALAAPLATASVVSYSASLSGAAESPVRDC